MGEFLSRVCRDCVAECETNKVARPQKSTSCTQFVEIPSLNVQGVSFRSVAKQQSAPSCTKTNPLSFVYYLYFSIPTETYHMIDRCDPSIATWSAAGDNFVVKNVEKFASVSNGSY